MSSLDDQGKAIMLEKRFFAVPPQPFISNGTQDGVVKVAYSGLFKVKQEIIIRSNTQPPTSKLEIKRILDVNTIEVGPLGHIHLRSDLSAYTVADNAVIFAIEQVRPKISYEETTRAVYEEEPTVAYRVIGVDPWGNAVNWAEDGLVPSEFDDVQITRDLDEDVVEARFFLRSQEIKRIALTYNIAKSVIRARKVGP